MFVDASAMIGIIAMEDDWASLAGRLDRTRVRETSAMAIFEAAAGLARVANSPPADALAVVNRFMAEIGATVHRPHDRRFGAGSVCPVREGAQFGRPEHG